jgi:hypothetical protein
MYLGFLLNITSVETFDSVEGRLYMDYTSQNLRVDYTGSGTLASLFADFGKVLQARPFGCPRIVCSRLFARLSDMGLM